MDRATADIILIFSPGRRYQISDVVLSWEYSENADAKTKRGIDPSILSSMITLEVGKYYNSEQLSETQRNLSSATFFAGVEVSLGDLNRDELQVPIVINLKPRKRKAYNFEIGVVPIPVFGRVWVMKTAELILKVIMLARVTRCQKSAVRRFLTIVFRIFASRQKALTSLPRKTIPLVRPVGFRRVRSALNCATKWMVQ